MMHQRVCSFTLIYAGGDLTQANSLDPGHTRETSDRSGLKSLDNGQNLDDPAWDHSSLLIAMLRRLLGIELYTQQNF